MPNNVRDMWLYQRPVIETLKNNKKIIIPSFSAPCGFLKESLDFPQFFTNGNVQTNFAIGIVNLPLQFTVECWVKLTSGFSAQTGVTVLIGGSNHWSLNIQPSSADDANKLRFDIGTFNPDFINIDNHVTSIDKFPMDNKWHHIAATFLNALPLLGEGGEPILGEGGEPTLAETGEIALFIDGVLQGSVNTVGNMNQVSNLGLGSIPDEFIVNTFALGRMSDVRLWNYVRTQEQIIANKGRLRGVPDNGLVAYWKLRGSYVDSITGLTLTNTTTTVDFTDDAPEIDLGFGASFIAEQFPVSLSSPCSLRFPQRLPVDADHALCVSWVDVDTGEFKRRLIYGGVGEDIDTAPGGKPIKYSGEKLAANFTLEFWNIDGNATINLLEDLTLFTSHTSNPGTGIDHSNALDDSPSGDSTLAAPFPWVFNTQQTYV